MLLKDRINEAMQDQPSYSAILFECDAFHGSPPKFNSFHFWL